MKQRKLFVTTALPYANAGFHIGHIMEYTQADIWVRFLRMQGHEVHFVCADDAHGAPIMLMAEKQGMTAQQLVAATAATRPHDLNGFHISFDHWHSTESPENLELCHTIYRKLKANKLITTKTIEQFFDPVKGMFLADRYIKGECPKCHAKDQYGDSCEVCGAVYAPTELINPYSALTGAKPVLKESEHYFLRISEPHVVEFLREWALGGRLQPEVANKIREWLEGDAGLADWDISRDAPYLGIEIPDAPGKYFYVWLDAPICYLASLKAYCAKNKIDFDALLADPATEQIHFIGKDIIYFHTLFWPAILKFSGFKVPDKVYVHGFVTITGEKMSKSRGSGISPRAYLELGLNPEWFRYYIAAKLNDKVEDIDFNPADFLARVNSDLIGKYVNIASRCAGFLTKKFDGVLAKAELSPEMKEAFGGAAAEIAGYYEGREFGKAVRKIMALADIANQYVDANKPWELAKLEGKEKQLHAVCSTAITLFRELTLYLKPILPSLAAQAEDIFQFGNLKWSDAFKPLAAGHKIKPYQHLMTRVDQKQMDALLPPDDVEPVVAKPSKGAAKAAAAATAAADVADTAAEFVLVPPEAPKPVVIAPIGETISIDDFSRLDLRVARILTAELVPEADKLLRLTLDLGIERRTVFAGIRAAYTPDMLVGRLTIMVANLAARKMRFGESQGMVLAAGDGSSIYLLAPDAGAVPGMRIK